MYHDSPTPFWAAAVEKAYTVSAIRIQRARPKMTSIICPFGYEAYDSVARRLSRICRVT